MSDKIFLKKEVNSSSIISLIKNVLNSEDKVVFAYLYGSFIDTDEFFNDLDIGIYAKDIENPFLLTANIKEQLESVCVESGITSFASDDFDIRIINDAPFDFVINILNKGLLIVDKDESLRTAYIEHISMEYRINQIVLDEALT